MVKMLAPYLSSHVTCVTVSRDGSIIPPATKHVTMSRDGIVAPPATSQPKVRSRVVVRASCSLFSEDIGGFQSIWEG